MSLHLLGLFSLFRFGFAATPPSLLYMILEQFVGLEKNSFFGQPRSREAFTQRHGEIVSVPLSLFARCQLAAVLASYAPSFHTRFARLFVFASELLRSVLFLPRPSTCSPGHSCSSTVAAATAPMQGMARAWEHGMETHRWMLRSVHSDRRSSCVLCRCNRDCRCKSM